MGGPALENKPPSRPDTLPKKTKEPREDRRGKGSARATSKTAQAMMVTPSSSCSATAIEPLIQASANTPATTPARLLPSAGASNRQFTCGLARASVTAAFTSDSTLTTLATSDTEAS